jgi:phosphoribosylformimino-5-aminoimidazole carboxamide ribotide isomerase
VNVEATRKLAQALVVPVIASGGLNDLEDVKRLCELESEGVTGCVAGRAIYEGKLDFAAAVKLASGEA